MNGQAYAETINGARCTACPGVDPDHGTIERAVGLLAGRAHCRLVDARRHLLRVAADQRRDILDVATAVLRMLDAPDLATEHASPQAPALVAAALAKPDPVMAPHRFGPWVAMIQQVLDVSPGMVAYLVPERDAAGRLVDLFWAAASPQAAAPNGMRGRQLIGQRAATQYPEVVGGDRWRSYEAVLRTGSPTVLGPIQHGDSTYSVRAHRLGQGLLMNWTQHDTRAGESERLANTERLGNLGWGEWDLVSGDVYWSAQLYRIYERDPHLGPLSRAECEDLAVAEDEPLRAAARQAFDRCERVDLVVRVRIGGRIKHLRTVVDAVRDAAGQPLRLYGIVQDVTEQETSAQRLAEVENQLAEHRRTLAAEHELAGQLQRIILPLPAGPIELPGLKVAVRYLPAAQESLVGGDWYHAGVSRDGSVLLAIGDVAGHGTPAATTMAQLRHALRALAVATTDPGILLAQLNRLTCDLEPETPELVATAVVARFDPVRREVVWAQAGHPPPLLSRAGRTVPLGRPSGPMLGVVDDASYPTARFQLHAGDLLLLYTDGLVEHRRQCLDDGLATVIRTVDEAVRAAPQRPLAELLARLRQANPDDDTCILAARPSTGETADLRGFRP